MVMVAAMTSSRRSANAITPDDLLVVGTSRDWILRHSLFGNFPDQLANAADAPVIMIHGPEARPMTMLRQVPARVTLSGCRPRTIRP